MNPNADVAPYIPQPLPDGETLCRLAAEADTFSVRRRNGMRALNYAYVTGDPEQFRFPFSEMRGLIVNETGEVSARPFHKFFNWQEPGAAVAACPWDEGCEITRKMDGSLVYPALRASGELVWCTRSGPTDIAQLAVDFLERDLSDGERKQMTAILERTVSDRDGARCTPLFEFCSPENRIVVAHEHASLTLLAVRRIGDGHYWRYDQLAETFLAACADAGMRFRRLRLVDAVTADTRTRKDRDRFVAAARQLGSEHVGYVVAFPSGHRIKLKGEQYITLHRGRDAYARESHVLRAVLSGGMDDLTAILDAERAARVRDYGRSVLDRARQHGKRRRRPDQRGARSARHAQGAGGGLDRRDRGRAPVAPLRIRMARRGRPRQREPRRVDAGEDARARDADVLEQSADGTTRPAAARQRPAAVEPARQRPGIAPTQRRKERPG